MRTCLFPIRNFILYLDIACEKVDYSYNKIYYARLKDILKKYVSVMDREEHTVDDLKRASKVAADTIKETLKIIRNHLEADYEINRSSVVGYNDRRVLADFEYALSLVEACRRKLRTYTNNQK